MQNTVQKYDTQNMTEEELRALRRRIMDSMSPEDWRKQMMRGYSQAELDALDPAIVKMHNEQYRREREQKRQGNS
jgi:hypothetical protein